MNGCVRRYLFLKEKVHYQQDLVAMETEIFDFVFTQIRETDAALVPLLLEWLLLESEGLRLQRQIQEQLKSARSNDDSDDGNAQWVQNWDDSSQTYYYVHSSTGESRWEAPLSGYVDVNGAFVAPSWDNYRDGEALAQMSDGVTAEASVADGGDSVDASNDGNEHKAEEKEQQNSAQTSLHEVASHLETTLEQHASGGDANQLVRTVRVSVVVTSTKYAWSHSRSVVSTSSSSKASCVASHKSTTMSAGAWSCCSKSRRRVRKRSCASARRRSGASAWPRSSETKATRKTRLDSTHRALWQTERRHRLSCHRVLRHLRPHARGLLEPRRKTAAAVSAITISVSWCQGTAAST